jgi:hypothetical protein
MSTTREGASQDESHKPKITAAQYKRRQRECNRMARTQAPWTLAVEWQDMSPHPSALAQTVNLGTVQHQTGQGDHQVLVVPMETEQPVNAIATSWP